MPTSEFTLCTYKVPALSHLGGGVWLPGMAEPTWPGKAEAPSWTGRVERKGGGSLQAWSRCQSRRLGGGGGVALRGSRGSAGQHRPLSPLCWPRPSPDPFSPFLTGETVHLLGRKWAEPEAPAVMDVPSPKSWAGLSLHKHLLAKADLSPQSSDLARCQRWAEPAHTHSRELIPTFSGIF